ncbi:conserved protein of unknown function [Bradyrhizobium sp. ORS 285]|uniref:response regulator n=1 Tax=Bradyrhizobium sp. ORS 285 TaxID=115808 RepID=UPI000240AB82|nr:response regulator [Bradyrhizobium sp. ORS 285]CCD85902.1 conserved hypothetical protein [Bradyrhizobium sp. ORS 285]SMX59170.1 conserved protein of unknown function [Bradyrhizobium sp. ORS 285]
MNGNGDQAFVAMARARLVLVVEDEYFIAMDLQAVLADAGYDVLGPASTATDALKLLDDNSPSAAVLDVNLGDHRVTPVAHALAVRRIPFVLASAYSDLDLANEPLLAKAPNVGKPTAPGPLLDAVGRMLSAVPVADER